MSHRFCHCDRRKGLFKGRIAIRENIPRERERGDPQSQAQSWCRSGEEGAGRRDWTGRGSREGAVLSFVYSCYFAGRDLRKSHMGTRTKSLSLTLSLANAAAPRESPLNSGVESGTGARTGRTLNSFSWRTVLWQPQFNTVEFTSTQFLGLHN